MIIDTDSGENRVVLSTVTYVFGSLLVAIKPDAVADKIGDDGEVTPTVNLNLGLGVTSVAPLSNAVFTLASKSFVWRYTNTPPLEGAKPGNEGAEEIEHTLLPSFIRQAIFSSPNCDTSSFSPKRA